MHNYLKLLRKVQLGTLSKNRTAIDTYSIFGSRLKFDLRTGFPIVTTKKVNYKSVLSELLWFISGSANINDLNSNIWNEWASTDGNIGPIYGPQWRHWEPGNIDQLSILVNGIKKNPHSRRHIVNAWNVQHLPDESLTPQENVAHNKMALAPCHMMFQCYVNDGFLDMQVYQRSVDCFLGLPFNISSYATLLLILAQVCSLEARNLIWIGGDTHLYTNHLTQVEEQLKRHTYPLPKLDINPSIKNIDDFVLSDFILDGYRHHSTLKGEIAV